MHQKQFIVANFACQQLEQLFIRACLLGIDFTRRKLTGRMNKYLCIANFTFFTRQSQENERAMEKNRAYRGTQYNGLDLKTIEGSC